MTPEIIRPRRQWWRRLACLLGFHEGPFTIWNHSIDCDACGRTWGD